MLDIGYGSLKKMVSHHAPRSVSVNIQHVPFPITSSNQIIELVSKTLKDNTKLAIFDHITSNTAISLPIQELIQICHEKGIKVLIDGAHGLFTKKLTLQKLNPDFYTSNFHKWFCGVPGAGFLYASEEMRQTLRPTIVSHGFNDGFASSFIWTGCQDFSPLLSITTGLKFWDIIGRDQARLYIYKTTWEAAQLLSTLWDTSIFAPKEMTATMVLIELPIEKNKTKTATSNDAKDIQDLLHFNFNTEASMKCLNSKVYFRLSCHIYNDIEQFKKFGIAMIQICEQKNKRDRILHLLDSNRPKGSLFG